MPAEDDTRLAEILLKLSIVDQAVIDEAVEIQAQAKEEGKEVPLAHFLVKRGSISYGIMERVLAHLENTSLVCGSCETETHGADLDPRATFMCSSCGKPLKLPERAEEQTSIEDFVADSAQTIATAREGFIGKTMAQCKIVSKIGEGGMGAVYRATHQFLQRDVAVKILPEYHVHQPGFVERFIRESRSAAQVIHPNVVQVMDAGRDGETYYIIMEFVEGKSLEDILKEDGRLPVERALEYARQCAMGLRAAAEHGIIHRDIKPDNIRISPKDEAKVADFGLAKQAEGAKSVTMTGGVVGTPLYMSPEQAHGEKLDFRSDIYSLGGTLYHLIAGKPPFEGPSAITILQKHATEEPPRLTESLEGCPPEVNDLVLRMLAKKREDRFESYTQLVEVIEQVQASISGQGPKVRLKVSGRRRSPVVPVLVVAALLLGAAGVWFLTKGKGEKHTLWVWLTGEEDDNGVLSVESPSPPPIETPGEDEPPIPPEEIEPKEDPKPKKPPPPALASAKISSVPDGAKVFFNEKPMGVTPVDLENLPLGDGTFRLELEGHEPLKMKAQLQSGKLFEQKFTLTRIVASVRILSSPEKAAVFIESKPRGETPLPLDDLIPGTYKLRVELTGYEPHSQKIELVAGSNPDISVPLKALPTLVQIKTVPPGATIFIDGTPQGPSPLEMPLAAGEHAFEARLAGYISAKWEWKLEPGENKPHTVPLVRLAEIRDFLSRIDEVQALVKKGFFMRASTKMSLIGASPRELPAGLRRDANALQKQINAEAPHIRLVVEPMRGRGKAVGSRVLPKTPRASKSIQLNVGRTFNVTASSKSGKPLSVSILRFTLINPDALSIYPKEGVVLGRGKLVQRVTKRTWSVPKPPRNELMLIVMLATPDDLFTNQIDDLKVKGIRVAADDALDRGRKIVQLIEDTLEQRGIDFGIRALWVDMGR